MADFRVHLSQAKHNEEAARMLVEQPPFHDWGITAAFYSAVHYFECWLFRTRQSHTETSIPVGSDGKLKHTPHAWREKIVERDLSQDAFRCFRKLRDASETARYLSLFRGADRRTAHWLDKPASEYFQVDDARKMVENDLARLRDELGIA